MKKVLLIVLGLVAAVVIAVAAYVMTAPDVFLVEQSTVIDGKPADAYAQVNNLPNWENWSPWAEMDPAMTMVYSDPAEGVGAYYEWDGPEARTGKLEIVENSPNEMIKTAVYFDGSEVPSNGLWSFEPTEDGKTNVTWTFSMDCPGFGEKFFARMFGGSMNGTMTQGLANLKAAAEANPVAETPVMIESRYSEIEEMEVASMPLYSITRTFPMSEHSSDIYAELFGALGTFCGTNGIEMAGMPLAIYHEWPEEMTDDAMVTMEAAFPVAETAIEGADEIHASESYGGKVVKLTHYGPYENAEEAHIKIDEYIKANNLEVAGAPWEVYANDPTTVDAADIETEVYYPVQ